jgi:hypothetical protein
MNEGSARGSIEITKLYDNGDETRHGILLKAFEYYLSPSVSRNRHCRESAVVACAETRRWL